MPQVDITRSRYFLCEPEPGGLAQTCPIGPFSVDSNGQSPLEDRTSTGAGYSCGSRRPYTICIDDANKESAAGGQPTRATFKRWLLSHLPITAALLEGDTEAYLHAQARTEYEDDIRRNSPAQCVYCRAPLIHIFMNEKFCPYQRAGENQHRRARAQLMGRSK